MDFLYKIKSLFLKPLSKKEIILILLFFFLVGSLIFLFFPKERKIYVSGSKKQDLFKKEIKIENPSPFSGVECKFSKRRAIGVVLAQYPQTIPLSGISQADIVVEWPVANPGGITRLLAIFQCKEPKELGSIRSLRPYIADIAFGFDVVLVSWGGARSAIEEIGRLNIDWLDGRVNIAGAFFRKNSKLPPHNGFATFEGLLKAIKAKKFRETNEFEGYKFLKLKEVKNKKDDFVLNIDYYYPVKFVYDKKTGNYLRYWDGKPFFDALTNKQVFAKNVILMKTQIGVLSPGVAWAKVIGEGETKIYQMGKVVEGRWKKNSPKGKLYFFDNEGEEIKFVPGPIWIEIVDKF